MNRDRLARPVAPVFVALAALAFSGCSDPVEDTDADSGARVDRQASPSPTANGSEATASEEPTTEVEPTGPLLEVAVAGNDVSPNATEISVGVGEPITVKIESDRDGELHVHSSPEQFVAFEVGVSNGLIVIDTPGKVTVEDHATGAVVALVEVR